MFDSKKFPRIETVNVAEFDKLTKTIANHYNSVKAREHLHRALDMGAKHAAEHGDASLITRLWDALPVNAPHHLIKRWLEKYTNLTRKTNKAGVVIFMPTEGTCTYDETGWATPFYAMPSAENAKKAAWDLFAAIQIDLAKASKKAEQGKLNEQQASALPELVKQFNSIIKRHSSVANETPAESKNTTAPSKASKKSGNVIDMIAEAV